MFQPALLSEGVGRWTLDVGRVSREGVGMTKRGRWALEPPFPLLSLSSFFLPSLSFPPSSFPFLFPSPSPPSLLFCAEIFFLEGVGTLPEGVGDLGSGISRGRWALGVGAGSPPSPVLGGPGCFLNPKGARRWALEDSTVPGGDLIGSGRS